MMSSLLSSYISKGGKEVLEGNEIFTIIVMNGKSILLQHIFYFEKTYLKALLKNLCNISEKLYLPKSSSRHDSISEG